MIKKKTIQSILLVVAILLLVVSVLFAGCKRKITVGDALKKIVKLDKVVSVLDNEIAKLKEMLNGD